MKKKTQTKIDRFENKKKEGIFSKNNRIKIIIFILSILVIFLILTVVFKSINNDSGKTTENTNTTPELNATDTENYDTDAIIISGKINTNSRLSDFYATGKPSFIVFAGTYCGHCKKIVPELEKEIWDNYNEKANIWINVIDGKDGAEFSVTRIAQGYNENISYEELIGDCGYVPAYVILDKEGDTILRSCGSEKTIEQVKEALDSQLN